MIPQETVNLILDTARIEEVVGDFVALKRRGASYVACCPFHNEKTPSFHVTPSKGIYKCFGCGKAGSAVGFVMEYEHISYAEALRYLAGKYHIEIQEKEESSEEIAARQYNESLMLVSEFTQKFFVESLDSPEGKNVARAYLHSRGIEDGTIAKFGLGWAPSGRSSLHSAATAAGFKEQYLLESGVCTKYDDGRVMDSFFERVMFPIHSVSGRVIAYSGRALRSDVPAKYKNSPETPLYKKRLSLYGIYQAKSEISRRNKCFLVEGNVDVVMLHQLGIPNVVASCGTALTVEQVRLIKKFTDNITIMYDGDRAGIKAALRGISLVLREGVNLRMLLLPDGEDPDSFARKHTLEEFDAYIREHEQDFIGFKSELLAEEAGGDPLKRAALINDIADSIADIPDPVKRSVCVESVAMRFNIDSQHIFDRIARTRLSIKENERKETERAQRWKDNGLDVPEDMMPVSEPVPQPVSQPPVAVETDLLYFILNFGRDFLDFPSDSPYYSGSEDDKPTVFEFIREALEADDAHFSNDIYEKIYDSYAALYDSGVSQEKIILDLLDSTDRAVADTASALSTEKYRLTVKNFEQALTNTSYWLVCFVPKAILLFAEKRLQDRMVSIKTGLQGLDPDAQIAAMKELVKLQTIQKNIKKQYDKRI